MSNLSISGSANDIDLFGKPVLALRDRRGRKSFAKTKENQRFVMDRAADGWTHSAIATVLGCHEDTLRKHFSGEMQNAHLNVMSEMLDILHAKARQGNIAAVRMIIDRSLAAVAPAPRKTPPAEESPSESKPAALGKKEQRLLDAQETPADYGDIRAGRQH